MIQTIRDIAVIVILAVTLAGCGNSDITLVKNGTMDPSDKTTVGKAFGSCFDNAKWEKMEGARGERIVKFTGSISKNLHDLVFGKLHSFFCEDRADWSTTQVVKKLGMDSPFFEELNKKHGCHLEYFSHSEMWRPVCADETSSSNYMREAGELLFADPRKFGVSMQPLPNDFWRPGTPVEVIWIVSPDGKSFSLESMASADWAGVKLGEILHVIYEGKVPDAVVLPYLLRL